MIKKSIITSAATALTLLISVALISLPASAAGKFYKWVDENGVTHYTPTPPAGAEAETVKTFTGRSSATPKAEAKAETEEKEGEQEGEKAAEGEKKEEKPASTKNPQACKQAKAELERAQRTAVVRQKDEDGNTKVVNKDEMLKAIRERIKKFC